MAAGTIEKDRPSRIVGALAMASGAASLLLLVNHPGGQASGFSGMVKEEAANQLLDGIIHGGFIIVLSLQAACYAVFSTRRGPAPSVVAGMAFFATGSIFLAGSMLLDGLILPAVAARYAALAPDKIEGARGLFVLMGAAIRFLMPFGLSFQAAAIASWGLTLLGRGQRIAGAISFALGVIILATLASGNFIASPLILMGAIVGTALWAFVLGGLLYAGRA